METKTMRVQHLFNADKKKQGPLLVIEMAVIAESGFDEAVMAHQWNGNGIASKKEMDMVERHYGNQHELRAFSGYMREVAFK